MPARKETPATDVSRSIERNTNAMRQIQGQLERMQHQIAGIQSLGNAPFQELQNVTVPSSPSAGGTRVAPFGTLDPSSVRPLGTPQAMPQIGSYAPGVGTSVAPTAFGQIRSSLPSEHRTGPTSLRAREDQVPQFAPSPGSVPLGPGSTGTPSRFASIGSGLGPRTWIPPGSFQPGQIPSTEAGTQLASEKRNLPPVQRQPSVDLIDAEENLLLEADVPGVSKEDLDVTVYGDVVTIRAQVQPSEAEGAVLLGERVPTVFRRTLRLPMSVRSEEVQAKLENGILTVTIPKEESGEGPHRIKVQ